MTRVRREALSNAGALDERWDRSDGEQRGVAFAELRDLIRPIAPPAIIWRTAFCCPDRLASCLDAPGASLVLKRPMALVDLNAARRSGVEAADDRLAAAVLSCLGRRFDPNERVIVVAGDTSALLPDAAAIGAPMLMLYSSCRELIALVAAGGEDRRGLVRRLMAERVLASGPSLRWRPEDLYALSDLQVAAIFWHCQVAEFRAITRAVGPGQARALDMADVLAAPGLALARLDQFFGLGLDRARILAASAKFGPRSETPSDPSIDALVEWSYRVCPETPRVDPIGSPLSAEV